MDLPGRTTIISGVAHFSSGGQDRPVLTRLRAYRPGLLHVVDPFKIDPAEAVHKADAVTRCGTPALILASIDHQPFDEHMTRYVAAVKSATSIPVLLHFPPVPGHGFPIVPGADAVVLPALLGSEDDYYVWKSHLETFAIRYGRPGEPEPLLSMALTFGLDHRSYDRMRIRPIRTDVQSMSFYIEVAKLFGFDMVYLSSRHEQVSPQVCRYFRRHLRAEQMLFVSGGVRTRQQVEAYWRAGADYVVIAGALERPDWRAALDGLRGASLR